MSQKVLDYLQTNRDHLLEKLTKFLSIPSVSTDRNYQEQVREAGQFIVTYLNEIGFDKVELQETKKHPIVYAEYNQAGPKAPTVLFYGHYDVQPADPLEEWDSEPFQPELRNGRIYARGASDDKGQVFMHLAVFEAFMKTEGKIPLNVKLCIEGEEEIGSENLHQILHEKKRTICCRFCCHFRYRYGSRQSTDNYLWIKRFHWI